MMSTRLKTTLTCAVTALMIGTAAAAVSSPAAARGYSDYSHSGRFYAGLNNRSIALPPVEVYGRGNPYIYGYGDPLHSPTYYYYAQSSFCPPTNYDDGGFATPAYDSGGFVGYVCHD